MARRGPVARVNPPIREAGHAEGLWAGLADGTIDMLATDHAPHAAAEKTGDDIWKCWSGFGGLETAMPLMLTEVTSRADHALVSTSRGPASPRPGCGVSTRGRGHCRSAPMPTS